MPIIIQVRVVAVATNHPKPHTDSTRTNRNTVEALSGNTLNRADTKAVASKDELGTGQT